MDCFNILDLDNDVLNIIGEKVNIDNYYRIFEEGQKEWILKYDASKREFDIKDRPSVRKSETYYYCYE
jgi:hypothetical protein